MLISACVFVACLLLGNGAKENAIGGIYPRGWGEIFGGERRNERKKDGNVHLQSSPGRKRSPDGREKRARRERRVFPTPRKRISCSSPPTLFSFLSYLDGLRVESCFSIQVVHQ